MNLYPSLEAIRRRDQKAPVPAPSPTFLPLFNSGLVEAKKSIHLIMFARNPLYTPP